MIQIGGVYTTFCQQEGIFLKKYRDRNGRCIAILFKRIRVRGRCDSPEVPGVYKFLGLLRPEYVQVDLSAPNSHCHLQAVLHHRYGAEFYTPPPPTPESTLLGGGV